jgi:transcriptional regulator with XRE-family HTH domain
MIDLPQSSMDYRRSSIILSMHTIGERIRSERTRLKLTQLQVARAAGKTKAAISALERGASKNPRPETLVGAAECLGVTIAWLIQGTEPKWVSSVPLPRARVAETAPSYGQREQIKQLVDTVDESKLPAIWGMLISPGELHQPITPNKRKRLKKAS